MDVTFPGVKSPSSIRRRTKTATATAFQVCVLAASYFMAAQLGLALAAYHQEATLVWPPTGLALAALIVYGLRLWPGVFIGVMLLTGWLHTSWSASLAIATGNTLEAVLGAWVLVRFMGFRPNLERLQDVASFLMIGAVGCTLVSATIGTTALWWSGGVESSDFGLAWLVWWLGDAAGAVIIAPTLFMLVHGAPPWRDLVRRAEYWTIMVSIVVGSLVAFGGAATGTWARAASFLPFPFLVWAGTRVGPRGAVTASFSTMLIATLGTAAGRGPFVQVNAHDGTLLLWAYGMSMGSIAFTLAAVTGQRDAARQHHRSEELERRRVEQERLLLLERERITREMHDGLGGQLVSAIAMVERGQASSRDLALALRQALDDMRIVIDTLDPNTTDLRVSLGKLRARLEPLLRRNGIQLLWEVTERPALSHFTPERSLHLLRIVQEAVTNAIAHGHPGRIEVRIAVAEESPTFVSVEVRDDGRGVPDDRPPGGRGIRNMQTRAEALGAEIRIDPLEPGTAVRLSIPLRA